MKKLLLLLIIPFLSFGQEWVQYFGASTINDVGLSLQRSQDNGYIIAGKTFNSFGLEWDGYLCKTNIYGELEWDVVYGNIFNSDWFNSSCPTSDGGYIITGNGISGGADNLENEIGVLKINSEGEEEWGYEYSGAEGRFIIESSDEGYIVSGSQQFLSDYYYQKIKIIKIDNEGLVVWIKYFDADTFNIDETVSCVSFSMEETSDLGLIISARIMGYGNAVIKLSYSGELEWVNTFFEECPGSEQSQVIQTSNGDYFLSSSSGCFVHFNVSDILSSGNIGSGGSVEQTSDDGFIIAGNDLIKLNSNTDLEWTVNSVFASDVTKASDSGYVVISNSSNPKNEIVGGEIALTKVNSFGDVTGIFTVNKVSKKNPIKRIDILGRETTSKGFQLHIYDDGSVEKKYLIK